MNWVPVALALSTFNTIFILILATRPREVYDSEHNIDYLKIVWYSLVVFFILAVLYLLVLVFGKTTQL